MPAAYQEIIKFLTEDNGFTEGEKWVVKMQFAIVTMPSNFEQKLWDLACACDTDNLARLSLAFPDKIHAVYNWKYGGLGDRIRAAGLNI